MTTEALKAAATDGRNLKPLDAIKLKVSGIQKQLASAIPATMGKYLTPERMTRLFWQEARRNPTLLKCEPETIASGLMTAAQLGIEIGVQGQGWLVPYFNSKSGRHEAQFIIGYKGLIALSRRSGDVLSVETHIVYEKDKFNLKLGIETKVEHEPYLEGDRGQAKLVYGVARFKDGGYHFEWMPMIEVERIRARSKAKDSGPWKTDVDQMRRKTIIRRMANYLPTSIEFANALTIDDAANAGNKAVIAGQFVEVDESSDLQALPEAAGGEPAPSAMPPEGEKVEAKLTVAQATDRLKDYKDRDVLDLWVSDLPTEISNDPVFKDAYIAKFEALDEAAQAARKGRK